MRDSNRRNDKQRDNTPAVLEIYEPDTVPVKIAEYQNLVACRVILDMMLDAINSKEVNVNLGPMFKAAASVRELYL